MRDEIYLDTVSLKEELDTGLRDTRLYGILVSLFRHRKLNTFLAFLLSVTIN
jgi:hypothetical protein